MPSIALAICLKDLILALIEVKKRRNLLVHIIHHTQCVQGTTQMNNSYRILCTTFFYLVSSS